MSRAGLEFYFFGGGGGGGKLAGRAPWDGASGRTWDGTERDGTGQAAGSCIGRGLLPSE